MKPEIRFKDFSKDWRSVPLEICLEICTELNAKNTFDVNDVLSVSDEVGVINQIKHLGRSYAGKSVSRYKVLRKGQIVYTKSPLRDKPFGIIKVNNGNVGIVSVLYAVYKTKDGIYPDFIQFYFSPSFRINEYFRPLVNKGAKNTMNISDEMALTGNVIIPSRMEEQEQISSYFDLFDTLIQTIIKKIASLKQIKMASLQSMFPQEGETTPQIRFKGFEGEWKEEKARSIFKTFNEKNRPDLPVLSATQDKGMVPRNSISYNIFHDKSNEATYKHILPGQFVIHLRSFQGGFAHSSVEGITSPAYTILDFKNKEENHDYFWKYIFSSKEFVRRLELITYGIRDGRSINFDEFAEMTFLAPSKEEQQKIANYFKTLDRQITLQTRRLEKLKQIKAACLDKMFV